MKHILIILSFFLLSPPLFGADKLVKGIPFTATVIFKSLTCYEVILSEVPDLRFIEVDELCLELPVMDDILIQYMWIKGKENLKIGTIYFVDEDTSKDEWTQCDIVNLFSSKPKDDC